MKNNDMAAFPIMPPAEHGRTVSGYPYPDVGMTLRDYFAAKALGIVMNHRDSVWTENGFKIIAKIVYDMADAMLEARETA